MQEHYADEFNLSQLAARFYLTPSYLCSLFKHFTGYTVTSFLLKIRMDHASDYLIKSDEALARVSDLVGYSGYNYFCRLFKRYYGVSPTSYRKKHAAVNR